VNEVVGPRLGNNEGREDAEGLVDGKELGRFEIEGSLDSTRLGLEVPPEGLILGLADGIGVDGMLEGELELLIVGTGEGALVVGRAEGADVLSFFLRFQPGLRRQRFVFFLPLSFFRSSLRFFRHFFRILFRRPDGWWSLLLDTE